MVIQKAGGFCFKLSAGPVTVAVNPPSARSTHKISKFGSGIVLVSLPHEDWNGVETATHGEKAPFVISGPGAYDVGDVNIAGYASPASYGDVISDVGNTMYTIDMDGIRVLILGATSSSKIPADIREELDGIGIVLVPVGEGALDAKGAHELATSLEPNVIIPYAVGDLSARSTQAGEKGIAAFKKSGRRDGAESHG